MYNFSCQTEYLKPGASYVKKRIRIAKKYDASKRILSQSPGRAI